jgi:putative ABC transport system permease protein
MLNALKISLRNLYREKLYALINLAGLSLAIACCLILSLYLRSELSYDQHHMKHQRIYRVATEFNNSGQLDAFAFTPRVLGPMMAAEFDQIEAYVRLFKMPPLLISHEDDAFYWEKTYHADPSVLDIFTHDVIFGDPSTALEDKHNVAVSETFAKRYFADANPIGEIIKTGNGDALTITLVFADLPENSHLKYDALLSMGNAGQELGNNHALQRQQLWGLSDFTYFLLPADFKFADEAQMFTAFYERHMRETGESLGMSMRFWLQPLADIHLNSDLTRDEPTGNRAYLYAFMAVGLFIIVVACINYINLSTARSANRAKEVAMRKILGANRAGLMWQFLGEAVLFALLAMLLGIILVELTLELTPVTQLLGRSLTFSLWDDPQILTGVLLLSLSIGLVSGLYPALYLSSWAPLSALVSSQGARKSNVRLRQVLVLMQFIISIAVIICTLLMTEQMRYLSTLPLGFDKENRIVIRLVGKDLLQKIPLIKTELAQHPDILGVTSNSRIPGDALQMNSLPIENNDGVVERSTLVHAQVDLDYLKVMGMKLVQGRDFSQRLLTDMGNSVVVNQAMVRTMGWQQPLGKQIMGGHVTGVVEDFNFQSLHSAIEPIALRPFDDDWSSVSKSQGAFMHRYMIVNIAPENIHDTLSYLEDRFAEFDAKHPFEFEFLDDTLNALYQSEERLMKLVGIFAGICIFIACLGLFGLTSFSTEQRNKEIGIRKILGASAGQIILLLSKSILVLVSIGAVIGSLFAYLTIDEWLTHFIYRAEFSLTAFIIAAVVALGVAYITVALQSYKTAHADPVDALRFKQ